MREPADILLALQELHNVLAGDSGDPASVTP
jgi:hypothetical protein